MRVKSLRTGLIKKIIKVTEYIKLNKRNYEKGVKKKIKIFDMLLEIKQSINSKSFRLII